MSFTRTLGRRGRVGAPARPRRSTSARPNASARRRRLRVTPRLRLAVVAVVLLGGLLFGAWTWLRDSSLVAVEQVTITGEGGSDAAAIRAALRSAARNMTTLDVRLDQLRTAVAPFPEVRRLSVKTAFPHRIVIEVIEQRPVAVVDAAGGQIPVAADGTILRAVSVSSSLPTIPLTVLPVGRNLREGKAADAVALLAAAPYQLLPRISQVTTVADHGLVAQIRNGPSIYFGDTSRLAAKWAAAIDVLGDPASSGAAYIDVTDPARPAAGAGTGTTGAGGATGAAAATTAGSGPTTAGSPATASGGPATASAAPAAATAAPAASGATTPSGTPAGAGASGLSSGG